MKELNLGTEKNPLVLENESIARPLIDKHISKKELKFSDVTARGFDHFLFNLSGNPFISKGALRVGTFLYAYFNEPQAKTSGVNGEMGQAFYISDKTNTDDNHADDDYFRCEYRGNYYSYPRPLVGLIDLLSNFGIEITASNLLKALNELHDFHYITLSPRPFRKAGNKKICTRTCFRHIRLYRGMVDKPFYYYLKNKTVHKRKVNKGNGSNNGNNSGSLG